MDRCPLSAEPVVAGRARIPAPPAQNPAGAGQLRRPFNAVAAFHLLLAKYSHLLFGILFISRDRQGAAYSEEDLAFLQEIADRTALAVTNARLYREAQRELALRRQADAALKGYARQLTRSNRELQDFAFIASHDLQKPLRKILAFSERLASNMALPWVKKPWIT